MFQATEIALRNAPVASVLLTDFRDYMRKKTGLDLQNLTITPEFRTTLESMAKASLPKAIFQAILNVAVRLVSMGNRSKHVQEFIDSVMNTVEIFWNWWTKKWTCRLLLLLLRACPSAMISIGVAVLYILIDTIGVKLWREYIAPRLRMYLKFTADAIQDRSSKSS
uniref:Uncharacterized protein n=1 Tax=Bracon brevicornis TaxID=1563983 RepID=A0A6V7JQU8_9HYME